MIYWDHAKDDGNSFWSIAYGWPVLQYVGLKDKCGKEIYEGDILVHRNFIKEFVSLYEVQYGQFGFSMFNPKDPEVEHYYVTSNLIEVIGNIYENPKLMEEHERV